MCYNKPKWLKAHYIIKFHVSIMNWGCGFLLSGCGRYMEPVICSVSIWLDWKPYCSKESISQCIFALSGLLVTCLLPAPVPPLTAFNQGVEAHIHPAQCLTEKQTTIAALPETSTASSKHAAPTFRKSHKTVSNWNQLSVWKVVVCKILEDFVFSEFS